MEEMGVSEDEVDSIIRWPVEVHPAQGGRLRYTGHRVALVIQKEHDTRTVVTVLWRDQDFFDFLYPGGRRV
jgi:hypothetical protein